MLNTVDRAAKTRCISSSAFDEIDIDDVVIVFIVDSCARLRRQFVVYKCDLLSNNCKSPKY